MDSINSFIIPVIIGGIVVYGMYQGVPVFDEFIQGAKEGFGTASKILPSLIGLLTAVGMFKASGALDLICYALTPLSNLIALPPEIMPLAILRPISGSGSLAIFTGILETYGPDSYIGRVASVLQGSAETTFYTIAIYFGATKIRKTRHTLASSLGADIAGFIMSAITVRLFFGI